MARIERLFNRIDGRNTLMYDAAGLLRAVIVREIDGTVSYTVGREAGRVRTIREALDAVRAQGYIPV